MEWGRGAQGPLAKVVGLYLNICTGTLEFLVTPLLMGRVFLVSQGRLKNLFAVLVNSNLCVIA